MSKQFWAVIAVIAIVIVGIIWITDSKNQNGNNNASPSSHIEGTSSTGVKLIEYGDYQCPYCGQYYSIVKQVQQQYNSLISFQFRNLPLTSLHPNAFAGARAAEAASLQGKFWQMHNLLYEQNQLYYEDNVQNWIPASDPESYFVADAKQLGLNISEFKSDYTSAKVANTINADVAAFDKTGAEMATPTFFLDGKQIQPTESVASFDTLINAAIQKKTGKNPGITATDTGSSTTNNNTAPTSTEPSKSSSSK